MRVAIAGSTGLLGSALTQHLRRTGHDVVRLVRQAPTSPDQRRWDLRAGTIEGPGLTDVDAVVNLAGAGIANARWTPARMAELRDSRLRGTQTITRALADAPNCRVFLSGSAIGIYGDTGSAEVDELTPAGLGFLARLCQDWEHEAAQAPDHVRVCYLRTGHVLSRTGGLLGKLRLPFRAGLGGRIGDGQQYLSWIALADHLAAMDFLLTSEVSGPVNLTAPHPVTNQVFTDAFAASLHRRAMIPLPLFAVRGVFGDEMVRETMLSSQRVLPHVLEAAGFSFAFTTVDEALAAVA